MKKPQILATLSAIIKKRPGTKLRATTAAAPRAAMDNYDDAEPTTKLSSAFVVVLILHVVAVGGIYMFNSIKASRRGHEQPQIPSTDTPKPPPPAMAKIPPPAAPGVTAHRSDSAPAPATTGTPPVPKATAARQHIVKAGETASKIAFAFTVKTEELLAANNLKADAVLHPGQVLAVPAPKAPTKTIAPETHKAEVAPKQADVPPTRTTPGLHIVKKGDTATSIAKIYGLTAAELLKANKITDARKLQEGQTLTIPKKKG